MADDRARAAAKALRVEHTPRVLKVAASHEARPSRADERTIGERTRIAERRALSAAIARDIETARAGLAAIERLDDLLSRLPGDHRWERRALRQYGRRLVPVVAALRDAVLSNG